MKNYPTWKWIIVFIVVSLAIVFSIPTYLNEDNKENWFYDNKINLGLDLQGGSYLLIKVESDVLIQEELENLNDIVRQLSRKEKLRISNIETKKNEVFFSFIKNENLDKIKLELSSQYRDLSISVSENILKLKINDNFIKRIQESAIKQSLEIVRRRIDESGTKEPLIQRSGKERILLQLPGVKNPERIKDLLGKTAKLTFHMVDDEDKNSLSIKRAPFGKMIAIDSENNEINYLIEKKSRVGGEDLVDAKASFDPTEGHAVSFRFNTEGAQKFGKATSENIGKRFAVLLDGYVITAPVIRSAITGGSGIISGNFTSQEAADLAVLLRAGALPAPLKIIEERSVGPGLGADSISAGKFASITGLLLVCFFMILIYGVYGLIANAALLANLFIIVSSLGLIGATLTLPGIAGIVLTIGMAVDANVLVFERIKEELRNDMKNLVAVKNGFSRAISTILDANITTLIASLLLFIFGSGPIKGFSITLSIGVLASMFTTIMLTNFLVHFWLSISKNKNMKI